MSRQIRGIVDKTWSFLEVLIDCRMRIQELVEVNQFLPCDVIVSSLGGRSGWEQHDADKQNAQNAGQYEVMRFRIHKFLSLSPLSEEWTKKHLGFLRVIPA